MNNVSIYVVFPLCWIIFYKIKTGRAIFDTKFSTYCKAFSPVLPTFAGIIWYERATRLLVDQLANKYFDGYSDCKLYYFDDEIKEIEQNMRMQSKP